MNDVIARYVSFHERAPKAFYRRDDQVEWLVTANLTREVTVGFGYSRKLDEAPASIEHSQPGAESLRGMN